MLATSGRCATYLLIAAFGFCELLATNSVSQPLSNAPSPQQPATDAGTANAAPVYRVGGGVKPPRVITAVDPEYTELARKKKLSGICVVGLVVDAHGNPQNIRVVKSIGKDLNPKLQEAADGLDQNAINAVSKYRFSPGEYQGKPIPVQVNIEVSFKLF